MSLLAALTAAFDKSKTLAARQSVIRFRDSAGIRQVERATAAGSISTSGNLTCTVTGAGITGSPVALSVAVLAGDTPAMWAQKVRLAIAANAAISALYEVAAALDATITLTRRTPAANDATLNIALANGTSDGATTAAESTAVTAGAAVGPETLLLVQFVSDGGSVELGRTSAPGANNGPAFTARTWAQSRAEIIRFRTKEVKRLPALLGGMTGHKVGAATVLLRDPEDADNYVGMLSEEDFPCSLYRDPSEIAHSGAAESEATLILESHKDGLITWDTDVDLS